MRNLYYILILLAVALVVLLCFFYSLRQKRRLGRVLSGVLLSAFSVLVTYCAALFSRPPLVASIFYSLYFISNSWLSLCLFHYARVYTRRRALPKWFIILMVVWFIADNLSLLLDPWLHHEASYYFLQKGALSCWLFQMQPLFQLHLLLCYILLGFFFIEFLQKVFTVPRLYKKQYSVVVTIMLLCVAGNAIFLLSGSRIVVDLSVILYGVGGILIYYFTFTYLPRKLTIDIGLLALNEVNSAMIFFDMDGCCVYTNTLAEKWFGGSRQIGRLSAFRERLLIDTQKQEEKQLARELVNGTERDYRVGFQKFNDAYERYLGCFFQLDDVTEELRERQRRLYLATHDSLTGLYNQSTFFTEARDVLDARGSAPYCIITTNILQFKILNDLLGRETGDEMLRTIGTALKAVTAPGIVCGRLESDKFAVCAPVDSHLEESLEKELAAQFEHLHEKYNLSLTVMNYYGVYRVTEPGVPLAVMCDRANMALNVIKGDASCRIAYYDTNLRNQMLWESQLVAEIPQALRSRQFVLYFQPQVDSRTGRVVGAEALVRWNHPQSGLIAPGVFIPLLESMGLIYQLDQYVWEEACVYLQKLRALGYSFPVSVNVSPRDVYSGDIFQVISDLIEKYELPVESLNLEITESALVLDMDRLLGIIRRLQEKGFRIEMDDFGSGYSSLNTLKDIPVDVLKLDMRFLEGAKDPARSETILKMIVGLAGSLHIPLIAEGVEKREQVDFLASIGCYDLQGFYYSRPVPFDDFLKLLEKFEAGTIS